jgi:hypothetical protein
MVYLGFLVTFALFVIYINIIFLPNYFKIIYIFSIFHLTQCIPVMNLLIHLYLDKHSEVEYKMVYLGFP